MSRLTLLSTLDGVDPLPTARLGPPVRHAEEARAKLHASPAHRQHEANAAFERRVYPTPDGQYCYTLQAGRPRPEIVQPAPLGAAIGASVPQKYLDAYNHFKQELVRHDALKKFDGALKKFDPANCALLEQAQNAALAAKRAQECPTCVGTGTDFEPLLGYFSCTACDGTGALRSGVDKSVALAQQPKTVLLPDGVAVEQVERLLGAKLQKPAVKRPKQKLQKPTFQGDTADFYVGVWNKVIDLFKEYLGGRKFSIPWLHLKTALTPPSSRLFTDLWIPTQNGVLLAAALRKLAAQAPNLLKPGKPGVLMLSDTSVVLLEQYVIRCRNRYIEAEPGAVEQLVQSALAARNIPVEPLPEDDEPDEFEAAQLRAYITQGKD